MYKYALEKFGYPSSLVAIDARIGPLKTPAPTIFMLPSMFGGVNDPSM